MKRVLIDFSSQLDIIWSMKKRESGEELYIPLENKFHSLFAKATSRSPLSMARSVVRIFSDFPPGRSHFLQRVLPPLVSWYEDCVNIIYYI